MSMNLTLARPIGLPPHTPVAQKTADQRWLIANSAKNRNLFYINIVFSLQPHSFE